MQQKCIYKFDHVLACCWVKTRKLVSLWLDHYAQRLEVVGNLAKLLANI